MDRPLPIGKKILAVLGLLVLAAGCAPRGLEPQLVYYPAAPATAHAVHLRSFDSGHDLLPLSSTSWWDRIRGGHAFAERPRSMTGLTCQGERLVACDAAGGDVWSWQLAPVPVTLNSILCSSVHPDDVQSPAAIVWTTPDFRDDWFNTHAFVADPATGLVHYMASEGEMHLTPPDRPEFTPVALAMHNGELLVADRKAAVIDRFDPSDGTHLGSFPAADAPDEAKLAMPVGLAVDGQGRVLVADLLGGRVAVFGPDYAYQGDIGQPGDRYGDLGKPKAVAVGPDGVIFVADADFGYIHLFSADGQLLMLLGGPQDEPGGTPSPCALAVADTLPPHLQALVPTDFDARYYLFVADTTATKPLSLFAIGLQRAE